jgi:hypothetical protein
MQDCNEVDEILDLFVGGKVLDLESEVLLYI